MRLAVRPGGEVVLTVPQSVSLRFIEQFLARHSEWIRAMRGKMSRLTPIPNTKRDYHKCKETAREFIHDRLAFWNAHYGFSYQRVAIKRTTSLWGSCSRKGNLNFSFALIHLPRELADYVIVHELCHLAEHNHGPHFWALVARTMPHYQALKQQLRTYSLRA